VTAPGSVRVTVVVDVSPDDAFEVFTEETAAWYRPGITRPAPGHLRFDGEGRRVLRAGGEGEAETEVGRITVWEAGRRLVFVDFQDTEVEIRFEAEGRATKVTLEHRGLDRLPPDKAESIVQYGWRRLAFQFEAYLQEVRGKRGESG
jgi:uncharacterized protein YndB with AHSA1/START domain